MLARIMKNQVWIATDLRDTSRQGGSVCFAHHLHPQVCPSSRDISRFSPRIDRIFPEEALNPFFGAQDEGFLEFRSR